MLYSDSAEKRHIAECLSGSSNEGLPAAGFSNDQPASVAARQ